MVLTYPVLCPVVREWWAGAACVWEKSVGLLSKSSLECVSCPIILFDQGKVSVFVVVGSVVITRNFVNDIRS